jgi:hypothetical protein
LLVLFVFALTSCSITVDSSAVWNSKDDNTMEEAAAAAESTTLHFELRPVGALIEQRSQQRRRRKLRNQQDNDDFEIPSHWMDPRTRGVYATLHPPNDDTAADSFASAAYDDFVKYRHLSRFERQLRTEMGWDLLPHWHGNYSDTAFYLEKSRRRRRLLESMVGGRFDNYQGVPLSQGYGTHYVHLWVGTPTPQRQSVIVDTGSHFTGFPVKGCSGCGERHHTDPHFDPSKSESFRALSCPHECLENFSCDDTPLPDQTSVIAGARCKFQQAYTEGSSWVAYQARDIVYCGGTGLIEAVDPIDIKYSIPFVFGCLLDNTGLFVTQLADGIMGMSAHELTLTKQLYNARKLEYNMFAMCFRKELGTSRRGVTAGSMTLGGVSSTLDTSPMIYARNIQPYGWFTVFVEAIYVARNGGSKFLFDTVESTKHIVKIPIKHSEINVGRGVIVDSGTTDTYINSNVQPAFVKIWKQVTGMEYTHGPVYLTQSQLKRLPTLLVQIQGVQGQKTEGAGADALSSPVIGQAGYLDPERWADLLLAIPATNYMEYSPTLKVYTSRLFFTESRGGVLGANAMQGHNVLFDWQHGRIGFAQSSCAYDLIAGKDENQASITRTADSYGSDCVLAEDRPILSQTCMDTVNVAICEASDHPTNIEISGMEIWTLLVEAPGEPGSCEDAMREWSESRDTIQQIDESTTNCTMHGYCQEFRPCHVPCMKAIEYHEKKRKGETTTKEAVTIPHAIIVSKDSFASEDNSETGCQDSVWSACDFSCHQTRISSRRVQYDGGQYCVESSKEIRDCHVDACGRSDPCVVPFLVHAIFVFEFEGSADSWTTEDEDIFRALFVDAAHSHEVYSDVSRKGMLFQEGDVNVLATRPWYGNDDDEMLDGNNKNHYNDEELHEKEFNYAHPEGESVEEAAQGIQIILQISISNPKAQLIDDTPHRARKLLQEVGVMWSNLTQVFRSPTPDTVCDPYDLYPLAMHAHEIANNILPHPMFNARLVESMDAYQESRLVSSWTIGTQVYDEYINYLGPLASTPFFLVVKFLHEAFVIMTIAWLALCLFKFFRAFRGTFFHWCKQRSSIQYKPLSTKDQDNNGDQVQNQIWTSPNRRVIRGQSKEVEMTVTYLSSKVMKRRNSTPEY